MGLRISRAHQAQLLAEAAAAPRREVCGLLLGETSDTVTMIRPCQNIAPSPHAMFEIDPAALIAAHKAERDGGPKLLGCYHSHPNGVAEPSQQDREAAWGNDAFWLIIAANGLTAWKNYASGAFERVEIMKDD